MPAYDSLSQSRHQNQEILVIKRFWEMLTTTCDKLNLERHVGKLEEGKSVIF